MSKRQLDNYDNEAIAEGKALKQFYRLRVKPIKSPKASRRIVFGSQFYLAR